MRHNYLLFPLTLCVAVVSTPMVQAQQAPPDHVVIVIMENHSFGDIVGSPSAPNINALAAAGANIVNSSTDPQGQTSGSHAVRHPSQPNYLELYSGNNQGTLQDGFPGTSAEPLSSPPPFSTPNLGASLVHAGYTFATYSESLPAVGSNIESYTDDSSITEYERKHNPAVNWQSDDASLANTHLMPSLNQPFFPLPGQPGTGFPSDFTQLPTVSIVVPNQQHDMHDGTIQQADDWLKANIIDTYLPWAMTHNSLLIVTWDEDGDNTASNQIPTIFAGPMITPGNYTETDLNVANPYIGSPTDPGIQTPTGTAMNHYNVLSTIEDLYGLQHIGGSVNRPLVSDIFTTPFQIRPIVVPNNFAGKQGDTGNLFPLFSSQPIRYQQVYEASQFSRFAPGGELITSIAFRGHGPGIPFTASIPQLQVNLSTTSKTPDNLSSTFADNIGPDDTMVFSGPLQATVTFTGGPTNFEIVIHLSTPFVYDPSKGNLLLDIRNLQGGTELPADDQEIDCTFATGDSVSRVYNYGDSNATAAGQSGGADEKDSFGLITQFGSISAVSRKTHGSAGIFDIPLPLGSTPGVECRSGGATNDYQMVITFPAPVTSAGAMVSSGTGSVKDSSTSGNQVIVDLTGVTDAQTIQVTLLSVNNGTTTSDVTIPMSVLVGDTNADRSVDSADISQTKSQSGQSVTGSNFREDPNADGSIDSADISLVKSKSGTALP